MRSERSAESRLGRRVDVAPCAAMPESASLLRVTAIVRPARAEQVCLKLLERGLVRELTAVECRGYGRQKGHLDAYAGDEYRIDFLPKVLIEGLVDRADEAAVRELILANARTGRIGDGKIFFVAVEHDLDA
jgi:nitrogen regulatory protein P-II 1